MNKEPKTRIPRFSTDGYLLCPLCREIYLQHHEVRTIVRGIEDGPAAMFGTNTGIEVISSEQAPGRRNSVEIDFYCKHCGKDNPFTLLVKQHKGVTFFEWEDLEQEEE
jgi:hypothetical protein